MSTTTATTEGVTPDVEAVTAETTTPPVSDVPADLTLEDAWKLIQNQRAVERDAKRRAAQLEAELSKRTKAEADAEAERLKADQKWEQYGKAQEERAAAAEQALETERLKLRDRLADAEIRAIATRLRFHKPEVAARLIDRDSLEYDDDGSPVNAEALLTELAKSDDYLVAKDEDQRRSIPSTPRGANPSEVAGLLNGDASKESERRIRQVF